MTWVIYTRVSSEDQVLGASLDMQQAQCQAMATGLGVTAELVVDDGYSGKDLRRPGIARILDRLRAGQIEGIMVWKLDRLTRSLRDLIEIIDVLVDRNASLVSLNEKIDTRGPMGRFILYIMGAVAQLERETIAARVKASRDYLRSKGCYVGGRLPPGCRRVGQRGAYRLEPDPVTGPLLVAAFEAYASGASLADIARQLKSDGVTKGIKTRSLISAMLRNDLLVASGVIPKRLFDRVAAVHDQRDPGRRPGRPAPGGSDRIWPLAGIAQCGACGSAMVGISSYGRNGTKYYFLRCCGRTRQACAAKDLPAEAWESAVCRLLHSAIQDGEYQRSWEGYASEIRAQAGPDLDRRRQVEDQLGKVQARISRLLDLAGDGDQPMPGLRAKLIELEAEAQGYRDQIDTLTGRLAAVELIDQQRAVMLDGIRTSGAKLLSEDPAERASGVQALVARVTLSQDPSRIEIGLYEPGAAPQEGRPRFVQTSQMVHRPGQNTNPGRSGMSWPVIVLRDRSGISVQRPEIVRSAADLPSKALAARLGITRRQAQRLRLAQSRVNFD